MPYSNTLGRKKGHIQTCKYERTKGGMHWTDSKHYTESSKPHSGKNIFQK